jgi:hypothetical protein
MNICTTCGYIGNPKSQVKGSFGVELILWLLFIIPGLIYSMWRITSQQKVCPACKNPTLIPVTTPKGQELLAAAQKKNPAMVETAQKNEKASTVKVAVVVAILIIVGAVVISQLHNF